MNRILLRTLVVPLQVVAGCTRSERLDAAEYRTRSEVVADCHRVAVTRRDGIQLKGRVLRWAPDETVVEVNGGPILCPTAEMREIVVEHLTFFGGVFYVVSFIIVLAAGAVILVLAGLP